MSAFTYPGVYIEELTSGVHTITGVATSIAAFVGWAPQGPVSEATLVESWSDFQTLFGGLDSRSYLGYAVNQFFANGGDEAYIVRLIWDGSLKPAPSTSPAVCTTALATGVGYGTAEITAAIGSVSGGASVGLGPPVLQSIAVAPAAMPPMPIGATVTLSASPTYSDGGSSPALTAVNWVSSDSTIVSVVAGTGVATAMGAGTATLTATSGLVSGSVTVTVTSATYSGIAVTIPVAPAVGQTQQATATASYSGGTALTVTATVAWSSSDTSVATVGSSTGLVSGLTAGPATITATIPWTAPGTTPPSSVASASLTVVAAVVMSAVLFPASPTLETGQTTTFHVWGTLSSTSPNPVPVALPAPTPAWTWTSSNPLVATAPGGVVTIVGPGTTTITAASGSVSASTTLTVNSAALTSISVSPPVLSVAGGLSQQLKATGIYADGTSADLTGSVAWTTSAWTAGTDATILPSGLLSGIAGVTAASTGSIQAAWQGQTGTASVTVNPPVLQSIKVTAAGTPPATSIPSGATLNFSAQGTYSDGTEVPLNGSTPATTPAWSTSPPGLANVTSLGVASALAAGGSLTLFANNPGAWGNNLRVSVTAGSSGKFNILVQQVGTNGQLQTLESFVNLSVSSTDPQYVVTVVDNDSNYITFVNPNVKPPAAVVPTVAPSPTASPIALSGGADGEVLVPASDQNFELALLNKPLGVYLLDRVDIFNLLCIPAETDAPTIQDLQQYCNLKRAFYIVDPPQAIKTSSLISSGPVGSTPGSLTEEYASNSTYYFPWVQAPDPLFGNRPTYFPPCGFVAGIYAATDASRGVWKAPAGINAGLTGVSGLQYLLTDAENGSLNPQAVNCLRQFKVYGDVVWGARTLAGNDQAGSEYKYIPIRRLALFLESSLYDGTQWVVFEPNDETLWGQIRLNVGTFLQGLFLQGAFAGTTPAQAYFVKCDAENNPGPSVALGIVNILVGFAPLYPAEFVVIQIQQIAQSS